MSGCAKEYILGHILATNNGARGLRDRDFSVGMKFSYTHSPNNLNDNKLQGSVHLVLPCLVLLALNNV